MTGKRTLIPMVLLLLATGCNGPRISAWDAPAIAGADTNADGIRDDLEPELVALETDQNRQTVLRLNVKALQAALIASVYAQSDIDQAGQQMTMGVTCLFATYPEAIVFERAMQLEALVVNTPLRQKAYQEFQAQDTRRTSKQIQSLPPACKAKR